MSIATLILGESGTGKSTSLRNLDPKKTLLIQCDGLSDSLDLAAFEKRIQELRVRIATLTPTSRRMMVANN